MNVCPLFDRVTAVMVIGHDDMGVMGICRCRLSLPKERNPFRQCKEKGIGRGMLTTN